MSCFLQRGLNVDCCFFGRRKLILLYLLCRYAAGTTPWSNSDQFRPQSHDDGYLEIIGFTTASLVSVTC